jgi:hypothetical protein
MRHTLLTLGTVLASALIVAACAWTVSGEVNRVPQPADTRLAKERPYCDRCRSW